ncbi:hypothetical protein NECAME_12474 [Necator americanus]|uniref:Uncharacterized protein n=1 Tax=Necator americanus TaxID=51031 RepID=W2T285_NECAM|nr:hypothetical protein NECAME_12474 [Necator americanus]ETN75321.1 hypothetical protein NECAME_12474 [Necator americanus]
MIYINETVADRCSLLDLAAKAGHGASFLVYAGLTVFEKSERDRFKAGNEKLEGEPRSGRPTAISLDELKNLAEQHPYEGVRYFAASLGCSLPTTLLRFDCMPAVDTASATRPFSPNGSCTTCRYDSIGLTETRLRHLLNTVYETVPRDMRVEELLELASPRATVLGVNTSIGKNVDSFGQTTIRIGSLRMRRCGLIPTLTIFIAYTPTSGLKKKKSMLSMWPREVL